MKRLFLLTLMLCAGLSARAQLSFENMRPVVRLADKSVITTPAEGLWSVATGWQQDWMSGWVHASAKSQEQSGEWTILSGSMTFEQGELLADIGQYEELGIGTFAGHGIDTLIGETPDEAAV